MTLSKWAQHVYFPNVLNTNSVTGDCTANYNWALRASLFLYKGLLKSDWALQSGRRWSVSVRQWCWELGASGQQPWIVESEGHFWRRTGIFLSLVFPMMMMMMIMMHQWHIQLCSGQCCFKISLNIVTASTHFFQSSKTRYHNPSWLNIPT